MDSNQGALTAEQVAEIAAKDDFHIAPYRADGKTFGTLTWIWVVQVDDSLYVRAYNGIKSRWYQSAISQKAGKIKAAGKEYLVAFEKVDGAILNAIDQAYRQKYADSPYLGSMISERARAATVKVESLLEPR
ncbi:DUF2255 family protein [Croceimicrobium sp.]|uniref:DUF2255 family protein n=1 Tax=Croceimicrobium sp. TaxID=2828340 RepID=UPI003BABC02A